MFGDTLLDILRTAGIGPSLRWVDNFVFFSIQREHLPKYNEIRETWRRKIDKNGRRLQRGGRYWYKGGYLPSGHIEEFAEDMTEPLRDLMGDHRNGEDMEQAYMMKDIDKISTRLGIPWE